MDGHNIFTKNIKIEPLALALVLDSCWYYKTPRCPSAARISRFSNRNYNLVGKHRQHNIHIHAGMMTIIQHTNQPNLIHPQDTIRNVDRFQSDPMYNAKYQSTVEWYSPFVCPRPSATHSSHKSTNTGHNTVGSRYQCPMHPAVK